MKKIERRTPKKMTEQEQKKVKLTPEMLMEKQVQLEGLEMKQEISELTLKHYEKILGNNFPLRQTQVAFNNEKKQLEFLKHNIAALKIQIETGEL
jgi:hypothetical protein